MVSIIFAVLLGMFFTILAVQNPQVVSISFFNNSVSLPLYIMAAISFLLAILIALVYHLFDKTTALSEIDAKNAQLNILQRENQELRRDLSNIIQDKEELAQNLAAKRSEDRKEFAEETRQDIRGFFGRIRESLT